MKIILLQLAMALLPLAAIAGTDDTYNEFYRALQNYIRTFKEIESAEAVSEAGIQIMKSWQRAKPMVDESNPKLSKYLDERTNFLLLATYMVQYNPEWDIDGPVYDEKGNELANSYTDAWKKEYAEATVKTSSSYILELEDRLRPKHPKAEFRFKNGLCYNDAPRFLADAIALSALEALHAMIQEKEAPTVIDVEAWSGLEPNLRLLIDEILEVKQENNKSDKESPVENEN